MYYFCTYFDRYYLTRALALYGSLARQCPNFHLFALCMDESCYESLNNLNLPQTTAIRLEELEQSDPDLPPLKGKRSKVEYYHTCGPSFVLFLLNRYPEIDLVSYLDADLFFFSDPKPLFDDLGCDSVGIIEHRYSSRQQNLKRFGIYNVGWVSFRHRRPGLECLRWWRERCIEWCYDRVEGNKFADQKYLEEFPSRFEAVRVIHHPGANLAPWNISNHQITEQKGQVLVDGRPLIFFHFQGLKEISGWLFDTNLGWYHASPSALVRRRIFGPYIDELRSLRPYSGSVRSLRASNRNESRGFGVLVRMLRMAIQIFLGISGRAYIVRFGRANRLRC
jgi:hypothetical protein